MKELFQANIEEYFEEEELINFVRVKKEYYRERFQTIKETKNTISWNWAAFVFSGFWFLYRKMYLPGAFILLADTLLTNFTHLRVSTWIISILCGLFANYQYLDYCNTKLNKMDNLDIDKKEKRMSAQGGVSVVSVIVGLVLIYLVALLCAKF